jgi:hypothetical protein
MDILPQIYNAFHPTPLPANSKLYVDCKAVRGGSDVLVELGKTIRFSEQPTCQLYTGHRGGGKSTELLRLKHDLEQKGCTVVYFSAEDEDVNTEDVEYTDILMACTRHLLKGVKEADPKPVLSWLRDRWQALEDLLMTDVSLKDPKVELNIHAFTKITAGIRTQPTQRAKLRELLNPYTETLVDALNEFIADAKCKLPRERQRLVVIADGLEKVTLVTKESGRTNHDEIFIDRAEQLKKLQCDVIYTVPISLALSCRASDLMEIYNCAVHVLPMVMVEKRESNIAYPSGIEILTSIISSRVRSIDAAKELALENEIFDEPATLNRLCLMSGGHVRNLMLLMQLATKYNEEEILPIQASALEDAIWNLRKTYHDTVNADQWELLAAVHCSKKIPNDDAHRGLLFTRCLLEYREGKEKKEPWYDVHPLLRDVSEFKDALNPRIET